jgi:hypothetical protein
MAIMQLPFHQGYQKDKSLKYTPKIAQLDRDKLSKAMDAAMKDKDGLVKDYEFMPHTLQKLMNNNEFMLCSSYTCIRITVAYCPMEHLDIMGEDYLTSVEMW